ncbi:hypothetical protein [Paenibacillus pini]|uniref:Very-long-chain (3R)-3-hydroxyacyl-CoA dehydratase n=1 Tax=Paenibacillus pini JCM 16418 TaxID=1236976 RepID=W7YXQ8_9BACL|nr:hypothetical protein [Paenibacillus pini]GAF09456.1 hypothetical protein JCM16418_3597 [Paenibacillus pini JCM 16418]
MYAVVNKLLYFLKSINYILIAGYTFFQVVLKQHNTFSQVIDVYLLWFVITAATLEAMHNFITAVWEPMN